jgi:hypothetical protein
VVELRNDKKLASFFFYNQSDDTIHLYALTR